MKHFRIRGKCGKGAKHIVKQREGGTERKRMKEEKHRRREAAARRTHWAMKKAFEPPKTTDSGHGDRTAAKFSGGGEGGRVDGQPSLKELRREDKSLHPSWEAKKRMKEKEPATITLPDSGFLVPA